MPCLLPKLALFVVVIAVVVVVVVALFVAVVAVALPLAAVSHASFEYLGMGKWKCSNRQRTTHKK